MVLLCVFALCILSGLAAFFSWKRTAWTLLLLSCVIFYLCISGIIPKLLLSDLQGDTAMPYQSEFGAKNAIVVLGGGASKVPLRTSQELYLPGLLTYSRIEAGAKTYFSCKQAGKQCLMILSGGDQAKTVHTEASLYKKEMLALGVKEADIILEDQSLNTFDNARNSAKIIFEKGIDPHSGVYLVTSGFHIRRSVLYFSFFYLNPRPVASDYFSVSTQWLPINAVNLVATDFALKEYLGILRFHVYNLLGLQEKGK